MINNNVVFSGTKENDFLKNQIDIQQKFLQKTEAFYHFRDAYSDDTAVTSFLEKEFSKLAGLYTNHRQELAQSEHYAAHYLELIYFLNGFGSRLYPFKQAAENRDDAISFISDQLSMDVLYSSGLWNYVISSTFELYTDKIVFGQDMIKNLQRTHSQKVFDTLANDLITICEQFGWINAEDTIVSYLASSGRLKNVQQNLSVAMELNKVKVGSKAIPIQGIKNLANTLLIFYESGCPLCSDQLKEIKEHYPQLKEKKIRVLSIASDRNKNIYEEMANTFPWPDKLCDFEGFEGKNFRNYGILGTPTLYVIDKKGNVVGRYAKLIDTGLLTK
jgi:peroxiredoxin